MGAPKLAPGSILTLDDQVRLYTEAVGEEKARKQIRMARLAAKKCVCNPRKLKRHWNGEGSPLTIKTVHEPDCPKWKTWMGEI